MNQVQTQVKEPLEMVVYASVPENMRLEDRYIKGTGLRPTFSYVAQQYGCRVEFRTAGFREDPFDNMTYFHGPQDGDELTALVLVGEDRAKLAQARDDIHRTFGCAKFDHGSARVTGKQRE